MNQSNYSAFQVKIAPLTPLWTGDIKREGKRVLETGILGSLRWWYEAILRGFSLSACDPTKGSCAYDSKRAEKSICLACQLFGCTGLSRKFRLMIEGDGDAGERDIEVKLKTSGNRKHRGWRIPSRLAGELTLSFMSMRSTNFTNFEITALYRVLCLIESYGALGAKTSQGQGVIRVIDWGHLTEKMSHETWKDQLTAQPPEEAPQSGYLPDLRDFIGATIVLNDALDAVKLWEKLELKARNWQPATGVKWIPSAPRVRAHLRGWLRDKKKLNGFPGNHHPQRHRLMGTINKQWRESNSEDPKNPPKGSDIFVSHLYMRDNIWRMRIFAFIPKDGNEVDKKMRILLTDPEKLKDELRKIFSDLSVKINPYPLVLDKLLNTLQGVLL